MDRLSELEARFERLRLDFQDVRRQLTAVMQQLRDLQARAMGSYTGAAGVFYFVVSPGFSAATGTSPSLSPNVQTGLTVYKDVNGTQTQHLTGQTVRWFYKDAGSAGKLVAVVPSADGASWDALLDSCTRIDV